MSGGEQPGLDFDSLPKNFILKWKELCALHKIQTDISEGLQEYLFHQRKNCSTAVFDTLCLIPKYPHQTLKDPLILSVTRCLTSFCDWIRKCRDIGEDSFSPPIRYFRLLYSLSISIYILKLIFEMSSQQSDITLRSLPTTVRKGVVQCLSILGFNCSDYQLMRSNPENSQLTNLLEEKFYLLFPEITSQSNIFNQSLVISFFHCCYHFSCPCLVNDLFGDIDDVIVSSRDSNLRDHTKFTKVDVPVLPLPPSDSTLKSETISGLHLGALTKKNAHNVLLSRCRTSPMNGHRLALERRLQKQPVARNQPILNSVRDVGISKKRSLPQESKGISRRRLVVEDTPVRNSSSR
jgi:hypothetical protein